MAVRGLRKLVLHNKTQTWQYSIGKTGVVVLYDPQGKKHVTDADTITGRAFGSYERGLWKESSDACVQPSDIRNYIEKHF